MIHRSLVGRRLAGRVVLAATAVVLIGAAAVTSFAGAGSRVSEPTLALSERLGPHTWGFAVPVAWLTAPLPGLRQDDILDLLGARPGERATATEVATGLRVMTADERSIVVELTANDAAAIASARARGLSLVPILRSTR